MKGPQILLLTHGGWGMSLLEGVKMVLGAVDFVSEVPLRPQVTLAEYREAVKAAAETMPAGSVMLSDMFGGTTTNAAIMVGRELDMPVVCGLNAPLLIEACMGVQTSGKIDLDAVLETGLASVRDPIADVTRSLEEKKGGD